MQTFILILKIVVLTTFLKSLKNKRSQTNADKSIHLGEVWGSIGEVF